MRQPSPAKPTLTLAILITLAILTTVGPISTDLYLPAFPEMLTDLLTTASGVQLTLTAFFFGAAIGQLIFGALSDRVGRKIPLLIGIAIYLVMSIAATFAPTITLLVVFRFVQGLSAAASMVISRAIVADLARGADVARTLSIMMIIGGVAPVLAPVVGSLLAPSIGWRGLLACTALLGVVALPLAWKIVPRYRLQGQTPTAPVDTQQAQKRAVRPNRFFWGYVTTFVFSFASLMAYISASPFVYQRLIGMSEPAYGVLIGINALGFTLSGAFSAARVRRYGMASLIKVGLVTNLLAVATLLLLAVSPVSPWFLLIPLFFSAMTNGLVFGNVTAMMLETMPGRAGTASAIQGFFQFLVGGVVAPIVGLAGEFTAVPMAVVMFSAAIISTTAFLVTRHRTVSSSPPNESAA